LTLDEATFLEGVFLVATLLGLTNRFGAAAAFLAGRPLALPFFAAGLAAVALLALGLVAGFAFTARFAVFAEARFAEDLAVDRRKPFVRLLLITFNLKRLLS
jgi:hypothetical protein